MADNQTQGRDQDVVTYEKFTGLRNDVTPERFGAGDLAVADNVDLDKSGRLARRAGYAAVLPGATHSLWADDEGETCLFAQGPQLLQLNTNLTATPRAPLTALGAPLSYVRVSERIYYSNGLDLGLLEAGRVRSWGLAVPPLPVPSVTVGTMPAGLYQFALTYIRSDGQESGAPLAGTVQVPAGSGLSFALPVSTDPDVTAKVLYLSTPGNEVLYQAAWLTAAATSTTYTNDTTELNFPLATQFLAPPPAGQLVAFYRGHLFVAAGDVLFYSSAFGYELFDLRAYVPLDGRITLLAPMMDKEITDNARSSGLYIGTDQSCGVLVGSDPKEFQYVPKTPYGALAGALDYVDGALLEDGAAGARQLPMWLTTQGICVGAADMAIRNLTRTKYTFPATGRGAALFMPGPNRFLATANL